MTGGGGVAEDDVIFTTILGLIFALSKNQPLVPTPYL